jgi:hypothetical protein
MKLAHYNLNESQFKLDLNVEYETVKLLKENTRENLHGICLHNDYLNIPPNTQATKTKIGKWNYMK